MSLHRIDLTPVYVLHTRAFSNTSLVVELFSQQYGIVSALARSARGPKSRYKGQLQLFTPLLASWSGRHELKMLGNLELNGMPLQLNQQPLFCGFYFNELLSRLLHKDDPHPKLFSLYHESLSRLENNIPIARVLRLFEKKLLEDLGYGLPLTFEAKTHEKIKADSYYHFVPNQGFFLTDDVHHGFCGADLLLIREEKFEQVSTTDTAKKIMRSAITFLLGNKPLMSRELFL